MCGYIDAQKYGFLWKGRKTTTERERKGKRESEEEIERKREKYDENVFQMQRVRRAPAG